MKQKTVFILSLLLILSTTLLVIFVLLKDGKITKKYNIAYYEGGNHRNYVLTLLGVFEGLVENKYVEKFDSSTIPEEVFTKNKSKLFWEWASVNLVSNKVEISMNNYWSSNWLDATRTENTELIHKAWKEKAFDAILTMGTKAGQDLIPNSDFPILLLAVADPITNKVLTNEKNVFTIFDPKYVETTIILTKELLGFKRLGVISLPNPTSELATGLIIVRKLSNLYHFDIVDKKITASLIDTHAVVEETIALASSLIKNDNIDAFLFTSMLGFTDRSITKILKELNTYKIPSISIDSLLVKKGVMLSFGMESNFNEQIGRLGAKALIEILKGTSPSSIKNTYEQIRRGLFINKTTLTLVGITLSDGIMSSALKIYD